MIKSFLSVYPTASLSKFWTKVGAVCEKSLRYLALFSVLLYRSVGAVHLGGACRFEPSCSCYAQQALNKHSFGFALKLILKRLMRCRPGGSFGYDPVPSPGEKPDLAREGIPNEQ